MNTLINIGRSFGSGGGYVGQAIGQKLGIPFYDNALISKVAEESGYSKSLFAGEEKRSLFSVSSFFASNRLNSYSKCLNVFVCAPEEYRIQRLMKEENLTEDEAEKLMRKKDRTRETYYNYYTFGAWGQAANYHLCIDSSVLGIDGTAEYIIDFGRRAGLIK